MTELLPLEVSGCTTRSFPRDVTVEQNTQCTLRNPNAFSVTVSFDASAETLGLMRFDLLQGDGDIVANGERQVVWSMTTLRDLADEDGTTFQATTTYALTTASNASLNYGAPLRSNGRLKHARTAPQGDASSGSNGLIIGLGAVAVVAGLVVAVVVLRRPEDDEDFTEDDLEDDYGFATAKEEPLT